ncbi:hypothetical protein GB937_008955 [Aspergillus fischeri]|nr:hypothetical protein GB937_008955 [Aspergillus fischeri]
MTARQLWFVTIRPGTWYSAHQTVSLGGVIVASRSDGHYASDALKSDLNNCLTSALKYEIWQYYGDSMSKAGTACGLETNPVEVASAVAGTRPLLKRTLLRV